MNFLILAGPPRDDAAPSGGPRDIVFVLAQRVS
jgi:hypothetical protein